MELSEVQAKILKAQRLLVVSRLEQEVQRTSIRKVRVQLASGSIAEKKD